MPSRLTANIRRLWDYLTASYWFVPVGQVMGYASLAVLFVALDRAGYSAWIGFPSAWQISDVASARALLAAIASSMISIATLTFSITIVALTLATSQYGSRLLYNFMRDRANQLVLGNFVGIFIYCLIVLRAVFIRSGGDPSVPQLAVFFALVWGVVGILLLIYFIHHVADSIQANSVIGRVAEELHRCITRFFPESSEQELTQGETFELPTSWWPIQARFNGILQLVDLQALARTAESVNGVIVVRMRAGCFVTRGMPIAEVSVAVDERTVADIQSAFLLGERRTLLQDVDYAFHQLVEVAVRALSPGINDPFTAIHCIDQIGAGLAHVMTRALPSHLQFDGQRRLRVVQPTLSFRDILASALTQLRPHAAGDAGVMWHLLQKLLQLIEMAETEAQREALLEQVALIAAHVRHMPLIDADRERFLGAIDGLDATAEPERSQGRSALA
ncbi:MAG: DUF2254 domain-containing protein [Pseudomonadota bacterium]|nr:DUF2254 domain-containing protein [Pseudomonadota bacterium]